MYFVTMAMIHVLSSCDECVDGGGRNATFLPGWRIVSLMEASFLFLESLEGPTELVRGGTVIETEREFPEPRGIGVPGDEPRGLLCRLSPTRYCQYDARRNMNFT